MYVHLWATQKHEPRIQIQKGENLKLNGDTSYESQIRNCNHPHGQENHRQKYISMV